MNTLFTTPATASGSIFDVTEFGAIGDGVTLNTTAMQQAIDDCANAGGGIVRFPAGHYVTGTIQIKSNVTLFLEAGATILGSIDAHDYLNLDPFTDGSGNPMGHALIVALDAENVAIEGPGVIDGRGYMVRDNQNPFVIRPFLVRWVRCTELTLRKVTLANPGAWTLNFYGSKDVLIDGITIRAREPKLRNSDGINIDSCANVRVLNCDVVSGDDALVIKATGASPSRNIFAHNCRLSTRTNAIKLGTESYGGFENITVSNCEIFDVHMAGIAMYAVDGADLRQITISDITMDGVVVPISIRLGSRLNTFREGQTPRASTGKLRDVVIKNVTAKNIKMIGMLINGVPGHPVEALTLENIQLELPGGGTAEDAKVQLPEREKDYPEYDTFGPVMPASSIYMRHAHDIQFHNVRTKVLQPDGRPATVFIDVEGFTASNCESPESSKDIRTAPKVFVARAPQRTGLHSDSVNVS